MYFTLHIYPKHRLAIFINISPVTIAIIDNGAYTAQLHSRY
jgi:hypothetical protein